VTRNGLTKTRYFTVGGDDLNPSTSSGWSMYTEHRLFMSPLYDPLVPASHADAIQNADGEILTNTVYDMLTFILADGNRSSAQTFFTSGGSSGSRIGVTIKNEISLGRSANVMTITGTDSTHPAYVGNATCLTQWSGIYGVSTDKPQNTDDPRAILGSNVNASYVGLKTMLLSGSTTGNSSAYSIPASVVRLGGGDLGADVSAYLPNASWITSVAIRTQAWNNNVDNYTGVDDARWHGTTEEVYADVIAALTPASGQVGAVNSSGNRPLASFP